MKVKVNITLQNIDKLQEHSITTDDLLNKHILENCRTLMLKAMQNNSSEVLCLINTTIYEAHFTSDNDEPVSEDVGKRLLEYKAQQENKS